MFLNFLSSKTHLFYLCEILLASGTKEESSATGSPSESSELPDLRVCGHVCAGGWWEQANRRCASPAFFSKGNAREMRMMTGSSDLLSVTVSYSATQLTQDSWLPCSFFSLGSCVILNVLAAKE